MAGKERIEVEGAAVYGPYSPAVKSNGILWLSGQIAPEAGEDITSQTKASFDKVDALLAAAGMSKEDACFVQVLLNDINDFPAMNDAYATWVEGIAIAPARAAFEAAALPAAAKVEIVVQAVDTSCCE
tara:strand:- start:411 stop:794 length:384 start_codon:yes stop_codon:yes gene_type:complete